MIPAHSKTFGGVKRLSTLQSNAVAVLGQKSVRATEQLVLVPLYLAKWGPEAYGEWVTLLAIPVAVAFSDLGVGSACANSLVLRYAAGERAGARNARRTGILLTSICIIVGVGVCGGVLAILSVTGWIASTVPSLDAAIATGAMVTCAVLFDFFNPITEASLRALGKASLGLNLTSIYLVAKVLATATVLSFGGGPIDVAACILICSVVWNLWALLWSGRWLREPGEAGRVNRADFTGMAKLGIGYILTPAWQAMYFQGSILVVGALLGPVSVATFATLRTVSRALAQLLSLVGAAVFPELQLRVGRGELLSAQRLFLRANLMVVVLAVPSLVALALWGGDVFSLVTQGSLYASEQARYVFVVIAAMSGLWSTAAVVFRAVNRPHPLGVTGVLASLVSLMMIAVLAPVFGLSGAVAGSLAFELLMLIVIVPLGARELRLDWASLARTCGHEARWLSGAGQRMLWRMGRRIGKARSWLNP